MLQRTVDDHAFAEHFGLQRPSVVTFPNLGADATLVVPCPIGERGCYWHLADFLRRGPVDQIDELWRCVAVAMNDRVGVRPVWLSTAGMGVAWLHIRLDDRPKYYGHAPYRHDACES